MKHENKRPLKFLDVRRRKMLMWTFEIAWEALNWTNIGQESSLVDMEMKRKFHKTQLVS